MSVDLIPKPFQPRPHDLHAEPLLVVVQILAATGPGARPGCVPGSPGVGPGRPRSPSRRASSAAPRRRARRRASRRARRSAPPCRRADPRSGRCGVSSGGWASIARSVMSTLHGPQQRRPAQPLGTLLGRLERAALMAGEEAAGLVGMQQRVDDVAPVTDQEQQPRARHQPHDQVGRVGAVDLLDHEQRDRASAGCPRPARGRGSRSRRTSANRLASGAQTSRYASEYA